MRTGIVGWAGLLVSISVCGADRPLVIAHRGGMALRPQNTMAAFRHAASLGVPIIEFDMNVTADDRIAIHHDTSVNPSVCVSSEVAAGSIRTLTLSQMLTFDCGSRRYADYPRMALVPGARIPTLEEVLGEFRDSKVEFLAETKMEVDGSPQFVEPSKFVGLVDRIIRRFGVADRFILQSHLPAERAAVQARLRPNRASTPGGLPHAQFEGRGPGRCP
jgi:glycerophosphoryl diester phosphodiesterase